MSETNIYFNNSETDSFPFWDDRVEAWVSAPGYEMLNEISEETQDVAFADLKHGKRWTHWQGCRGPICRKEVRDHRRRWKVRQGMEIQPRTLAALSEDALIDRYLAVRVPVAA